MIIVVISNIVHIVILQLLGAYVHGFGYGHGEMFCAKLSYTGSVFVLGMLPLFCFFEH